MDSLSLALPHQQRDLQGKQSWAISLGPEFCPHSWQLLSRYGVRKIIPIQSVSLAPTISSQIIELFFLLPGFLSVLSQVASCSFVICSFKADVHLKTNEQTPT